MEKRARIIAIFGWLLTSIAVTALYCAVTRPDLHLWQGMVTHGSTAKPAVALTFDDGPDPLWAPLIADTLEQHGARGTFFLVGQEALIYQEITARLVRGGHEIGNHSYTHPYPNLTRFSRGGVAREVQDANNLLRQFTGEPLHWLRPPGGGIDNAIIEAARAQGMKLAWWSYNAADAAEPQPEVTLARLRGQLRPGVVVLLHERDNTVEALARFFAADDRAHYRYTTFSNLTEP